jgi:hypothetical protein
VKVTAEIRVDCLNSYQRTETLILRVDSGVWHWIDEIPLQTDVFRSDFERLMEHVTRKIGEEFKRRTAKKA